MDASNMIAHELELRCSHLLCEEDGVQYPGSYAPYLVPHHLSRAYLGRPQRRNGPSSLNKKSVLRRAIAEDNAGDFKITNGLEAECVLQVVNVTPRANFRFDFPALEAYESLADVTKLQDMVELDKVIVITRFAEVGP